MINRIVWRIALIVLACLAGPADAKTWYYQMPYPETAPVRFYESIEEACTAHVSLLNSLGASSPGGYRYELTASAVYKETASCIVLVTQTAYPFNGPTTSLVGFYIVSCDDPNAGPVYIPNYPLFVHATCRCNAGYKPGPRYPSVCLANAPPEPLANRTCRADGLLSGNPILPATAEKYRSEADWADSGPAALSLERIYRSNWASYITRPTAGLGSAWTHNHSTQLTATPALAPTAVAIAVPDGSRRSFTKPTGAAAWIANDSADQLEQGPDQAWTYRRTDDDTTFTFDGTGRLKAKVERNGWTTTYGHNGAGQLATISNGFGRSLALAYNAEGQLTTVTTPDARVIGYAHDNQGRLSSVTYPDGKARTFLYENPAFPQALTGIVDESGSRWATFTYDGTGRAIGTELAGSVERYQVDYGDSGYATVTDPLGTPRLYQYGTANDKLAVTGSPLPSGTGHADARRRVQDANGLIISDVAWPWASRA